jgi:tetratricopeptide (TPR) repeat protein
MRGLILPLSLSLVVVMTLTAAPATAQSRDAARRLFDEATRQFEAGNHQLALQGFIESRRLLDGDARAQALILFNIARAQEELQRYDEALRSYQQYLDDAPSDAPYRESTLDRIRELRARVSTSSGSGPTLIALATVITAVGALAALGAIPTGILALDAGARLADACGDTTCPQMAVGLRDEAYSLGLATDVLWVAGASVAAVGLGLLIAGVVTNQPAPLVGAYCTEDGCGASLSFRF